MTFPSFWWRFAFRKHHVNHYISHQSLTVKAININFFIIYLLFLLFPEIKMRLRLWTGRKGILKFLVSQLLWFVFFAQRQKRSSKTWSRSSSFSLKPIICNFLKYARFSAWLVCLCLHIRLIFLCPTSLSKPHHVVGWSALGCAGSFIRAQFK